MPDKYIYETELNTKQSVTFFVLSCNDVLREEGGEGGGGGAEVVALMLPAICYASI